MWVACFVASWMSIQNHDVFHICVTQSCDDMSQRMWGVGVMQAGTHLHWVHTCAYLYIYVFMHMICILTMASVLYA